MIFSSFFSIGCLKKKTIGDPYILSQEARIKNQQIIYLIKAVINSAQHQ